MEENMIKRAIVFIALFLTAAIPVSAETIFYASGRLNPNETGMVCGSDLNNCSTVQISRLPDEETGTPNYIKKYFPDGSDSALTNAVTPQLCDENAVSVQTIQCSDQSFKFTVPSGLETGVYSVKAGDKTVYINCPYVSWVLGDMGKAASVGGTIRAFGESLSIGGATRAVLVNGDNKIYELSVISAEEYSAEFSLSGIPAGEYQFYVHNGYGGNTAWSIPVTVEVKRQATMPQKEYNLRDYGAMGNAKHDDSRAMERALSELSASGGGVLYIPRGRYLLTRAFQIPENTVIRGEGKELVSLLWTAYAWDIGELPEAFLSGTKNFTVENLTLNGSRTGSFIRSDTLMKGAKNITIRNVDVIANAFFGRSSKEKVELILDEFENQRSFAFDLGGENVTVTGCNIHGASSSLRILDANYVTISDNRIYNGYRGWYCLSGSSEVVFENNYISTSSQNGTGGGINNLNGCNRTENICFLSNTIENIEGNDREVMTTDGGGGCYAGTAEVFGKSMTVSEQGYKGTHKNLLGSKDMGVFIINGRGAGQYRLIDSVESEHTVTLNAPFEIAPDSGSLICIAPIIRRGIYTDTNIKNAGALQFYGMGIENIIDGTCMSSAGGINLWALYTYNGYRPCWYNEILNTTVESGNYMHWFGADDQWTGESGIRIMASGEGAMSIGTTVRNTEILNNAGIQLSASKNTTLRDVIIENTNIHAADTGISLNAEESNALIDSVYIRNYAHEAVTDSLSVVGNCNYSQGD